MRSFKCDVKAHVSTREVHSKLYLLSIEEESGIQLLAVKCVVLWRNTSVDGVFFFCNGRCDHQVLPSFPTRRSSDLSGFSGGNGA